MPGLAMHQSDSRPTGTGKIIHFNTIWNEQQLLLGLIIIIRINKFINNDNYIIISNNLKQRHFIMILPLQKIHPH